MTFDELHARWRWIPIRGCPGRYTLADGVSALTSADLVGANVEVETHAVAAARDAVVVTRFGDGAGLISYQKDGRGFLHTLNTPDGLRRKLDALGIEPKAS